MKRFLFTLGIITICLPATLIAEGNEKKKLDYFLSGNNTENVDPVIELASPYFAPLDDQTVNQTDLSFYIFNPDAEASTELYRTTDPEIGYTLIETLPPSATDQHYTDYDLKPRTTFYYRLRSIKGSRVSAFSDPIHLTTVSRLYEPGFEIVPQTTFLGFEITFTDNSYGDFWYDIYRVEVGTTNSDFVHQLEMLDSGRTVVFQDGGIMKERTEYFYEIVATGNGEAYPQFYWTSDTVTSLNNPEEEPLPPSWESSGPPPSFACGSEIALTFSNSDPYSSTEIWRSLSNESGFILIASADGFYMDTEVKPHTTYYYKLRTKKNNTYSEFSETRSFTSGSDFFEPELFSTALPDNTVEFSLKDHSYGEGSYEVYGLDLTTGFLNGFFATIIAPDSGAVHSYTDTYVIPGHEYFYGVSAILACDGLPVISEFSTQVFVPEIGPKILSFSLINADTDVEVRQLNNNDSFNYSPRYNIGVNASPETKSVAFTVNGKPLKDSQLPFALFGDAKGNYHKGHLKPGNYTLIATPYSGSRQNGASGPSVTIRFTVTDDRKNKPSEPKESVRVNIFPNPVVNNVTIEVLNASSSLIRIDIIDQHGNSFRLSQDYARSQTFNRDWNAASLQKGTYIITVQVDEKLYSNRVIVK